VHLVLCATALLNDLVEVVVVLDASGSQSHEPLSNTSPFEPATSNRDQVATQTAAQLKLI
jgi:hypothetical protein